jgi:hypothetical protein
MEAGGQKCSETVGDGCRVIVDSNTRVDARKRVLVFKNACSVLKMCVVCRKCVWVVKTGAEDRKCAVCCKNGSREGGNG